MIDHNYKFIYIHIPKTGGTSIELALAKKSGTDLEKNELYGLEDLNGNRLPFNHTMNRLKSKKISWDQIRCLQHLTSSEIKQRYGNQIWVDYYKFTVVRNPWDELVSTYNYIKNKRPDLCTEKFSTFKEWVINIKNTNRQNRYILDDNDQNMVDYIMRFENLQNDFNTVCDKIGITRQQLAHMNKTDHKHYTEYYDDETREIVTEKHAKDIEYFGYKFGERV